MPFLLAEGAIQNKPDIAFEIWDIQTKKDLLIINRFNKNLDRERLEGVEAEYLGNLAQDAQIEKISLNGSSLMDLNRDAGALTALNKIGEKIWQRN